MNPDFCKPANYVEPRDDGGSAFPIPSDGRTHGTEGGMSLRAYFAGQALPAVIRQCYEDARPPNVSQAELFAHIACECADALIAELNKP